MLGLLSRWQSFERSWRMDWLFGSFAALTVVSFSATAVARYRLNAVLERGEQCLASADLACVTQAAEQARALTPEHPRSRFLGLGARLLRGERDVVESLLRMAEGVRLDPRSEGARLLLLGDVEAQRGRPRRAREHYQAASPLVPVDLVGERVTRLDRVEREAREKRVADGQRWRADFERLFEAVEQGQQELISARSSALQQRISSARGALRELHDILASVTQIASRREVFRSRETPWRVEPLPRPPRSAAEERAWREAQEAREREAERRRQQQAAMNTAVTETLAQARERLDRALTQLEGPPPEGP